MSKDTVSSLGELIHRLLETSELTVQVAFTYLVS